MKLRTSKGKGARIDGRSSRFRFHVSRSRAFTLIEIMVVVAIMAVILAAGIPSLYGLFHKEGFRKTMSDLVEVCQTARAEAILQSKTSEIVLHPKDGRVDVGGGSSYGGWAHTAKIEGGRIEALRVNNGAEDYSQAEEVHVHFFQDGTCEEMTLVLTSDKNEMRGINLEITTGLPAVLNDAQIRDLVR